MPSSHTGTRWRDGLPPGVYERATTYERSLDVRMDVAAFVGLCERGPVATAVAVDSWTDFRERFGRPGGGRLLPDAVSLFFANGGRRAVVVRALPYAAARTARHVVAGVRAGGGSLTFDAHDPGTWGDDLHIVWSWQRVTLRAVPTRPAAAHLELPAALAPPVGTLLRRTATNGVTRLVTEALGFVTERVAISRTHVRLTVDPPLPLPTADEREAPLEELRGQLVVRHAELEERFEDVALHPAHPGRLAVRLAEGGSRLVRPTADTAAAALLPDGPLLSARAWTAGSRLLEAGGDAAATTGRDVFFRPLGPGPRGGADDVWPQDLPPLDALDAYDALHEPEPVSLVCVPDLLHPLAAAAFEEPPPEEPELRFGPCTPPDTIVTPGAVELDWPFLSVTYQPQEVGALQAELVTWCEARDGVVAVLDLPPGQAAGDVLTWREAHASMRAAAYAPWLRVPPAEDPLGALRTVPPCGVICGLVAQQERRAGVHFAPANLALAGVVSLETDPLLPAAGFLHEARVNLVRPTESGLRLLGSRTMSADKDWIHLSVRRLVDWLHRQIQLDARWAAFEPNGPLLWRRLVLVVERRLRHLQAVGAWAGATAADSWFVRCDESTTTQADRDEGRVVVLVGVAPAVPAEFLVFRVTLAREGESAEAALG